MVKYYIVTHIIIKGGTKNEEKNKIYSVYCIRCYDYCWHCDCDYTVQS